MEKRVGVTEQNPKVLRYKVDRAVFTPLPHFAFSTAGYRWMAFELASLHLGELESRRSLATAFYSTPTAREISRITMLSEMAI